MMIGYSSFQSKMGPIYLARTEHGLCRVHLGGSEESFRATLRAKDHGEPVRDDESLNPEALKLRSYLEQGRPIDGVLVGFLEGTQFERSVWRVLTQIPRGEVRSYSWVAAEIGNPKASRAVGRACGSNPVPFFVPCHRVVGSGGRLGGYGYGLEIKRKLLRLEGADVSKLRD